MTLGKGKHADKTDTRHFTHGTSASTADAAPERGVSAEDRSVDAPAARKAKALPKDAKPDQLAGKEAAAEDRQEALLDEGVEETFPGSDPVSVKRIT